jgi:beta-galactosidase
VADLPARGIWYGGDYNPEQWPEEVWKEDVRLMRRAGVTMVTVGVFSWARIQPDEGVFDYDWLDRVLGLLHANDIAVDLATGTASPPPWASTRYPDILTENAEGATRWHGSRQHAAPTSPDFLRLAADLVRHTAERYRDHPAVVLWHLNNELGCHMAYDHSDRAAVAFRRWLRAKYGDLDTLNDAWGTWFWSQRYTDFAQVVPPRLAPYDVNPGALLDFRRFSSDALLDVARMERDIIRDAGATQPVTTNLMGAFPYADYWKWAAEVDYVSDDNYPDPRDPDGFRSAAFARDLMRSLKPGRPWLLLEQAPNAVNWRPNNAAKAPGQMAALSMQAVARGADSVMFFQWRQSRAGSEKFHSGMLPHAGPRTRTFHEVERLGADLAGLPSLPAPGGEARVALVLDWDSWWAVDQPGRPARFDYLARVQGWHAALHERNVAVDIVPAGGPFGSYAMVVAPSVYLLEDAAAAALASYVDGGGRLLVTAFSDVVDPFDRFLPGGFTTRLGGALGLRVTEFNGIVAQDGVTVTGPGLAFGADVLAEELRVSGAEVLAHFAGGPAAGGPALTRHRHGRGEAYYLATMPDAAGRAAIVAHLLARADVRPVVEGLPPRVEASLRGDLITVINHSPERVEVTVLGGRFHLEPYGWRMLR